jgi:hypothetical protein
LPEADRHDVPILAAEVLRLRAHDRAAGYPQELAIEVEQLRRGSAG